MGRSRRSWLWVPVLHQACGPIPALPCLSFPPAVEAEHPPSSSGVSLLPPAHSALAALPRAARGIAAQTGHGKSHLTPAPSSWVLVPG